MRFQLAVALCTLMHVAQAADPLPPPAFVRIGDTESGPSWVSASSSNKGRSLSSIVMQYYIRVDGPDTVIVPIDMDYFFDFELDIAAVGPNAGVNGVSTIKVISPGNVEVFADTGQAGWSSRIGEFQTNMGSGEASFEVISNERYQIVLGATAVATSQPSTATASLWMYTDPYLEIQEAFAAANPGYTLSFSPGIENVVTLPTPVPEASTLLMLLFGLGLMGAMATRRRRLIDESATTAWHARERTGGMVALA